MARAFGPRLKPATLELVTTARLWGRWLARERRIQISLELIRAHPWAAVVGILAHELIHQAVSELAGPEAGREPPHGPTFQKLGRGRGLHPIYLGATVDLRELSADPLPAGEMLPPERLQSARVLEKVRKILALSGSPVAAEAQAAMKAAARLMARHNLAMLEEEQGDDPYEYRTIELRGRRVETRAALIAGLLGRHFFVQAIFTQGYEAAANREIKCLELLGRPENTRLAEHVFYFLMERTETLWQDYHRNRPGGGLTARQSFISGLLEAFDRKLCEAADPAGGPETGSGQGFSALVLARDQGLAGYFQRRYPHVAHTRSIRRRYNPTAGSAGQAAGRSLNLSRPLEKTGASPGETRLLGRRP